jgi:hypothetical protein
MTNRNFVLPVYRRFGSYEEVSPVNRLPVCNSQIEVVKNWAQAIVISPAGDLEVFPGVGLSDVVHFPVIYFDVYNRSSSSILLDVKAYGKYILDADKGIVTSGTTIFTQNNITVPSNSFRRFAINNAGYEYDCVQIVVQSQPNTAFYYRIVGVL